jgi:acyl carrier protein
MTANNSRLTRAALLATPESERQQRLVSYICANLASLLGVSANKLDIHQPTSELGLDSLMSLEMKSRTEADLAIEISVATFLQDPTIDQLAAEFLTQVTTNLPITAPADQPESASIGAKDAQALLDKIDQLSDDEVAALLGKMSQD